MNNYSENFERISETSSVSMSDEWFEFANENHFWMKWRFQTLKKKLEQLDLFGKKFLEIGCGNGIFKTQMEKEGYIIDGCDLNVNALKVALKGKGRLLLYNIFDRNPEFIGKYDGVFLMDVIEHIKDDTFFIKTAIEYVQNYGYIIINVPAHPYLFSNYDIEDGHFRRYTKKRMIALFKECNIATINITYWGFLLIPILLIRKLYLSIFPKNSIKTGFEPPNKFVHKILKLFMHIELSLPFLRCTGTSLIAIGKIIK